MCHLQKWRKASTEYTHYQNIIQQNNKYLKEPNGVYANEDEERNLLVNTLNSSSNVYNSEPRVTGRNIKRFSVQSSKSIKYPTARSRIGGGYPFFIHPRLRLLMMKRDKYPTLT